MNRVALLCASLVVIALAGPGNAAAPEEGKAPPEVLRAKQDAAHKAYDLALEHYRTGRVVELEQPYRWSVRWMEAERDLAADAAGRRAALEAHIARMKELRRMMAKLRNAGTGSALDAAAAEFYAAEAEGWLAQAKGK